VAGCGVQAYPASSASPYHLPNAVGTSYPTGLTNCSSYFHGSGRPDQYAVDFNMPAGASFLAARGGRVHSVVNDQPSEGGGAGNSVVIDHGDGTFGVYLHSPATEIRVVQGQQVKRGTILGVVGQSGLAGYPHLHFIVVVGPPAYPYTGVAISFRNADPGDTPLQTATVYTARP
jgi:murein DD-endopeptidase MepM/ murein hydrolase activator NlpD